MNDIQQGPRAAASDPACDCFVGKGATFEQHKTSAIWREPLPIPILTGLPGRPSDSDIARAFNIGARVESPKSPAEATCPEVERHIAHVERNLGIHTPVQRLLVALRVIPRPLIEYAVIVGSDKPERISGHREWAGYLDATAAAAEYDGPLSIEFLETMHRHMLRYTHPDANASIIDSVLPAGPCATDVKDGKYAPLLLTDREIEAVERNPYLAWQRLSSGWPNYGVIRYLVRTRADRLTALQEIFDRYNDGRSDPSIDAYARAAGCQQDISGVHGLPHDYNRRVSREVMNWSLGQDGHDPSLIPDFDDDLISTREKWSAAVKAGSEYHRALRLRIEAGEDDPVRLLELEDVKARYEERRARGPMLPPTPKPGIAHDLGDYKRALARLRTSTTPPLSPARHTVYRVGQERPSR